MVLVIVGKVDPNRTIEEMMKDRARSGVDLIDLRTGNLLVDADAPAENKTPVEMEKKPEPIPEKKPMKQKRKKK